MSGSRLGSPLGEPVIRRRKAYFEEISALQKSSYLLTLGQQSGGHLNPAVTLTFLRLGKVRPWDALFYIGAQFLVGSPGVGGDDVPASGRRPSSRQLCHHQAR